MELNEIVTKADLAALENRLKDFLKLNIAKEPKKDSWLTLKEAAAYIKSKPKKLNEQVRAGEIPFIRDGRFIKFDIQDLDNYMRSHRIMSDDESASLAAARG